MPDVKIFLHAGETEDEGRELLLKALSSHAEGATHEETFHQPAARAVLEYMLREHSKTWVNILSEISEAINEQDKP